MKLTVHSVSFNSTFSNSNALAGIQALTCCRQIWHLCWSNCSEDSWGSPCIMCVQYRGGAQYRGGVQYRGGYHEYRGGIS